jgi:hypothetical protein
MEILEKQKRVLNSSSNQEFDIILKKMLIEVENVEDIYYDLKIKDFKTYELISALTDKRRKELLFYSIMLKISSNLEGNTPYWDLYKVSFWESNKDTSF